MHLECHAALGWVIGNAARGDARLRKWAVLGAILPDIDAIPYVFGAKYYGLWHHTFGHNVFLSLLFALFVGRKTKSTKGLVGAGWQWPAIFGRTIT